MNVKILFSKCKLGYLKLKWVCNLSIQFVDRPISGPVSNSWIEKDFGIVPKSFERPWTPVSNSTWYTFRFPCRMWSRSWLPGKFFLWFITSIKSNATQKDIKLSTWIRQSGVTFFIIGSHSWIPIGRLNSEDFWVFYTEGWIFILNSWMFRAFEIIQKYS